MKHFLRDLMVFLGVFALLFHAYPEFQYWTKRYQTDVAGTEVYEVLAASKAKLKKKKLVIGDSVAKQVLDSLANDSAIVSLASNQAISMAGQYMIAVQALAANPSVDTLVLIYHPFSFQNNLASPLSFHYFVKPFYTEENMPLFSKLVKHQVEAIPFYYLARYRPVLTSNWSPSFEGVSDEKRLFSSISSEYVLQLQQLCTQKGVVLQIISPPINEVFKAQVMASRTQFKGIHGYIDSWYFYASANFLSDQIHIKRFDFLKDSPWKTTGLIR
jgi:hypothetical protein